MSLKLLISGSVSYYFCGSVSLRRSENVIDPLNVDLESLNDKEVIGLARAIKSGVVVAVEGEEALNERAELLLANSKLAKKSVTESIEDVKEDTVTETTEMEIKEVESISQVEEKVTDEVKATTKRPRAKTAK